MGWKHGNIYRIPGNFEGIIFQYNNASLGLELVVYQIFEKVAQESRYEVFISSYKKWELLYKLSDELLEGTVVDGIYEISRFLTSLSFSGKMVFVGICPIAQKLKFKGISPLLKNGKEL